MPTHDRQQVFEAAREVFDKHFEVTEASYTKGTIETKPQLIDRPRSGTLADVRGAGGKWRRTASFQMERDGLTVVARVAVRLEREATEAARAMTEAVPDGTADEVPRAGPHYGKSDSRAADVVWVEVGYDAPLARELLATIAEQVRQAGQGNRMPTLEEPEEMAEETRRLGVRQGL